MNIKLDILGNEKTPFGLRSEILKYLTEEELKTNKFICKAWRKIISRFQAGVRYKDLSDRVTNIIKESKTNLEYYKVLLHKRHEALGLKSYNEIIGTLNPQKGEEAIEQLKLFHDEMKSEIKSFEELQISYELVNQKLRDIALSIGSQVLGVFIKAKFPKICSLAFHQTCCDGFLLEDIVKSYIKIGSPKNALIFLEEELTLVDKNDCSKPKSCFKRCSKLIIKKLPTAEDKINKLLDKYFPDK